MEPLLRILMLLCGIRSYTLSELAERFGKSERTIYRYIDVIERSGFILERHQDSSLCRYRLKAGNIEKDSLEKLLHFTEEEAWLLYQTLTELKAGSPVVNRLIKKLHVLYDFKILAALEKNNELDKVHTLGEAIKKKKRVRLQQYRSSNRGDIADREVESFQFMEDYSSIWCFDIEDKNNKQFRISRMSSVEILSLPWRFENEHHVPFTDAFRMSADKPLTTVEVLLTLKAYNLLVEEYPLAEKYIQKKEHKYFLKIPVADYHGVGRFVMGLPGEVKVLGPDGFKEFLRIKTKKYR